MEQSARTDIGSINAAFIIDGWSVDLSTLRLHRGEESVKLEPKAMAVLEYLALRPGQVVSRRDLEESVWAGTVIGYDAISNAIIKLRKAFDDDAQNPQVIETIPKTGYRLIAPVETLSTSPATGDGTGTASNVVNLSIAEAATEASSAPAHWKIVTTISVPLILVISLVSLWMEPWVTRVEPASIERMQLPLPEKTSVAVWPFDNLNADVTQQHFIDGITQDLISRLSQFPDLFVVSQHSSFTYQHTDKDVHQFAEELAVHNVLKGSVQISGEKLRINVHLIDALSGEYKWAETYHGTTEDVFGLQDIVTAGVAKQLELDLNLESAPTDDASGSQDAVVAEAGKQPESDKNHQSPGATESKRTDYTTVYDLYFRGWSHFRAGTAGDYSKAVAFFTQALDKDPEFSQAEAARTAVYWNILIKGMWQESLGVHYYDAFELTRKALRRSQKNPTELTYQIASEWVTYYSRGTRTPQRSLDFAIEAIARAPNNPAGYLAKASALLKDNQASKAQAEIRTAMRLDPHYPPEYLVRLGQTQIQLGQYAAAVQSLGQATVSNPHDSWAQLYLASAYGLQNRIDEAHRALMEAERLRAEDGWGTVTLVSTAQPNFRWLGNRDRLKQGLSVAGARVGGEWFSLIEYTETGHFNPVRGVTLVSVSEAKELYDRGAVFISTRRTGNSWGIPGAYFLEWWGEGWLFNEATLGRIANADTEIVIYAFNLKGKPIAQASAFAVSRGFRNVYQFPGGLEDWKAAGYPMVKID